MSGRVLSTEAAKDAIRQIENTTNGGLSDQLNALLGYCEVLGDPNNWDGPLADRYRNESLPATKTATHQMREQLQELQRWANQVSQDIFSAGGSTA